MRIALVVVLFVLLGAAGYWWFDDEWYGWLTGVGVFALRVGPMFLWKIVLRVVRRQMFRILFLLLPGFCKQPVRTARFAIRKWCEKVLGSLRRRWHESWMIRVAVLVPAIVALCVIAYDQEGIDEFITLFGIPFLVTAIFPEGVWSYTFAYVMAYLASHGFEGLIEKVRYFFLDRCWWKSTAKNDLTRSRRWLAIAARPWKKRRTPFTHGRLVGNIAKRRRCPDRGGSLWWIKNLKRNLAVGLFNPDAGSALDLTEADIDDLFAST